MEIRIDSLSRPSPNPEPACPTRLVVANRNRMASQLLAESLARDPRFEIVGVAGAADVFSMIMAQRPRVVLLSADLDSGPKKGFQIARNLHGRHPSIKIVMLVETGTRESVIAAFRCGATGVFCGTDSIAELPICVERVGQGEIWTSRNHSEIVLEALRSIPSCEGVGNGKIGHLSKRELQVAEYAAQGQANKQIADRLGLSEHTIKNYLLRVFEKLGVSNRFELLFLLFKECNGPGMGRMGPVSGNDMPNAIATHLRAAEEGLVTAQFIVGMAHLEGYGIEKDRRSAYYWLRMAEENSYTIRHRSHALVEELRNTLRMEEIEDVEHSVAAGVRKNKLLKSERPAELIELSTNSLPRIVNIREGQAHDHV